MATKVLGYRCISGECYVINDSRLRGMGSPPSSPLMQSRYPGMGRFPMKREMLDAEELPVSELARAAAIGMLFEDGESIKMPSENQ